MKDRVINAAKKSLQYQGQGLEYVPAYRAAVRAALRSRLSYKNSRLLAKTVLKKLLHETKEEK
jgi:hypothetical protein